MRFFIPIFLLMNSFNLQANAPNTVITSIIGTGGAVFDQPTAIAITPNGQYAYVTNVGHGQVNNNVNVIDIATNTTFVPTGLYQRFDDPQAIAITQNGNFAYVADAGPGGNGVGSVIVIDIASNTADQPTALHQAFGYTTSIAITGNFAYVCNGGPTGNGSVNVIDITTNTIVSTPSLEQTFIAGTPASIAITPDGNYAYVLSFGLVNVIDIHNNNTLLSPTGLVTPAFFGPQSLSITPDGKYVYVACSFFGTSTVTVIDVATNTILPTPGLTGQFNFPTWIGYTPDSTNAYVIVAGGSSVGLIQVSSNDVIPTPGLTSGFNNPQQIAITGQLGYVTNIGTNSVTVIAVAGSPVVTQVNPSVGEAGTTVTITGSNFTGATAVQFGGVNATSFTVNSDSSITAIAPPGTGSVHVTVTTFETSATSPNDLFTYDPPIITSISPATGPSIGCTRVTIRGMNFTGASWVQFGPKGAASFRVISPTKIIAVSPRGSGVVNIRVTTPKGKSPITTADQFTYK